MSNLNEIFEEYDDNSVELLPENIKPEHFYKIESIVNHVMDKLFSCDNLIESITFNDGFAVVRYDPDFFGQDVDDPKCLISITDFMSHFFDLYACIKNDFDGKVKAKQKRIKLAVEKVVRERELQELARLKQKYENG